MAKVKISYYLLLISLSLCILFIHKSGYLTAFLFQEKNSQEYGEFSLFSMKGDLGYTADLTLYATQIKKSHESGFSLFQQDPFIYENGGKYLPNGNLIYQFASFLLFIFSMQNVFLFGPFISIFLTLFFFGETIKLKFGKGAIRSKTLLYISCALLILLTYFDGKLNLGNLKNAFSDNPVLPRDLGYIGRFPHIEFSIFILFFWLFCIVKFDVKRRILSAVLLGLSLAILQYSYFYYWTSALVFTGIYIVISNFKNYKLLLKASTSIFITYLICTFPFWYEFLQFNNTVLGQEFSFRVGKELTSKPYFPPIIIVWLIIFYLIDIFIEYRKGNPYVASVKNAFSQSLWQICLFITTLLLLNIQLFVGYTIQPYHWLATFYYPILTVTIAYYLFKLFQLFGNNPKFIQRSKIILIIFSVGLTVAALANNFTFGKMWAKYFSYTNTEKQLITFINEELPGGNVFMSNNLSLMGIINLKTNNYSYIGNSFVTIAPDDTLIKRVISGYKKIGYSLTQVQDELKKGDSYVNKYIAKIRAGKINKDDTIINLPDNYNILAYAFHRTFEENSDYNYSEKLDSLIKFYYPQTANYKLDYFVLYKKYLPQSFKKSNKITVFENADFLVLKN